MYGSKSSERVSCSLIYKGWVSHFIDRFRRVFESASKIAPVSLWSSPPKPLSLGSDEVHVWRAPLDLPPLLVESLKRTLSADEKARAEGFHFQKHRDQFIAARGILKTILGHYLNQEPSQLRFCYGPYGKPSLATASGGNLLRFNMSHSHGLALYAVTCGRELGVDLEFLCTDFAMEDIAKRFFSPREIAALRALPTNMRLDGFFNCWTRKEAYIKARGEGLTLRLDQFEVSLVPGDPPTLNTKGDPQEASRWSLLKLDPGLGYVAALSVEGHDFQLKCWLWPERCGVQVEFSHPELVEG